MKKLLLITAMVLCFGNMFSQEKELNEIGLKVDQMTKDLDHSKIKSGVLLNRSANLSQLEKINSISKDHPIDYNYFKQALLDLHLASNEKKFMSYSELKERLKATRDSDNVVFMGIINTEFQTLNYDQDDASLSGLKLKNGKFKKRKDKEPFKNHLSLLVSPLRGAAKGEIINYKFTNEFFFNNSFNNMTSLTADFGNGVTHQIVDNGTLIASDIQYTYALSGEKNISFTANYSDGTTKKIDSKIYVIVQEVESPVLGRITNDFVVADEAFGGYKGRMDYRIYYRTNEGPNPPDLKKPIIIIDGFDPKDKRRIEDADCANDPNCLELFNIKNFLGNVVDNYFSYDQHISMWDFNFYIDENGNVRNFIEDLQERGFDVVMVNNPQHQLSGQPHIDGGADYIQRNGLTFVKLIKTLNAELAANSYNHELVIVGPSMGGQISRYALAYMEKKFQETGNSTWDHKTRLWISIDSPHLGANIPMGLQAAVHQLAIVSSGAQDFRDDQLASPAARQQLIEQYAGRDGNQLRTTKLDGRVVEQGYTFSRGDVLFQNFYRDLFTNGLNNSDGYPLNLRKIALVNGSLANSRSYNTDDDPIAASAIPNGSFPFDGQLALNIRGFADIPFPTHIFSVETYFMKWTNGNTKVARVKMGPSIGGNFDRSLYVTNINSRGNMDKIPGGWFAGQKELDDSVHRSGLPIGYLQTRTLRPTSSFIASFSSIGHLDPDRSWNATLDKNLLCQNLTPFDSYFGEALNTRHTSFNKNSAKWLLAEIGSNIALPSPQEPYFPVNQNNLVGSKVICSTSNRTYTFNGCSVPGDVQSWAVSSNLMIIPGSEGANSVTIKAPVIISGPATLSATFSNGYTMTKDIWIGTPKIPSSISGPSLVNTGALVNYTAGVSLGATTYDWLLPYPFGVSNPIDYFNDDWQMTPTTGRNLTAMTGYAKNSGLVQVRGENICGFGGAKTISVSHINAGGGNTGGGNTGGGNTGGGGVIVIEGGDPGGIPRQAGPNADIKVYPNPASDEVNIKIDFTNNADGNVKIMLFDSLGRLLIDEDLNGYQFIVNTSGLANGNYILNVYTNTTNVKKKLIIKH